ncbi:hypothetical protein MCHIJ_04470 [Mycolicibacterium chitae]|uniref:Transmembrane protein n=1 Tax=Mycolicibacterium chitae TaxID=1792 RepID=A0A448IBM7_MYCCI|nr:hypothetical protein [Mycolicibacterium chitae]MCV7107180.1 hypothetical protein [Mycolicibacterium chitae]BBZ01010.1 hypothetical protein MCHIJ_04470 [Mycolicibacterium chitae]VEG49853.1 Uncharacterised protein [Mycolicibacterium chitae]
MLTIATNTIRLWWQTWPTLVALYLVGWFVRYWVLQGAIEVGLAHGRIWGSLVIVLAPIVRLLTFLGMFLAIRSVTPALQHVGDDGQNPRGTTDILLTAILPFLVIYTTWKLIYEDYYIYVTTVDFTTVFQGDADAVREVASGYTGGEVWAVIGIAFVLRQLITRFRAKLPRWTMALAVYFEVLWIFLTLQAGASALFGSPKWIAERRVMVWIGETRAELFSHFVILDDWWTWLGALVALLIPVLGLSLAWLAITAAVYGAPFTPTWSGARRVMLGHRADVAAAHALERSRNVLQPRWQRIPGEVQSRLVEFVRGQFGRFGSIVDAGRLILHGGLLPIAFFVAAYIGLLVLAPGGAYFDIKVNDGYLFRWVALVLGPHPWPWWESFDDAIRIAIGALIEPLRVCLVAATYWYCVEQVRAQQAESRSAGVESDDRRQL